MRRARLKTRNETRATLSCLGSVLTRSDHLVDGDTCMRSVHVDDIWILSSQNPIHTSVARLAGSGSIAVDEAPFESIACLPNDNSLNILIDIVTSSIYLVFSTFISASPI